MIDKDNTVRQANIFLTAFAVCQLCLYLAIHSLRKTIYSRPILSVFSFSSSCLGIMCSSSFVIDFRPKTLTKIGLDPDKS